jgi:hypothetical protein
MTAKKVNGYIPVTIDELMARFVTNMERSDCKEKFRQERKPLQNATIAGLDSGKIEDSVIKSLNALKDLLRNNTVDIKR